MASVPELRLLFRGQADIKKSVDEVKGGLAQIQAAAQGLNNALAGMGVILGLGALVGGLTAAVRAASESERMTAQLNATLKSTASAAGVTTQAALDLADSLSKIAPFEDEAILGAENLLLTFTNIKNDIFPQVTEAVLDMATAMGEDLKSASIRVGKALQDPILGVTALRRVGVDFNETQVELLKNLVETGRGAEAQAMILKELQKEFGGSARAAGETFGGQLTILRTKLGNVEEAIGNALMPALKGLVDWANGANFDGLISAIKNVPIAWTQATTLIKLAIGDALFTIESRLEVLRVRAINIFADIGDAARRIFSGQAPGSGRDLTNPLKPGMGREIDVETGTFKDAPSGRTLSPGVAAEMAALKALEAEHQKWRESVIASGAASVDAMNATSTATGVAARTMQDFGAKGSGAMKQVEESVESLLASALALRAAMPDIIAMITGGDLLGGIKALVDLGKSNAAAVSEALGIMDKAAADAKRAMEEAAAEAKRLAQVLEDKLVAAAHSMGAAIVAALKDGRDWAAGTAAYFKDIFFKGLETDIDAWSRKVQAAMADGLDIGDLVKEGEPLFAKYLDELELVRKAEEEWVKTKAKLKEAKEWEHRYDAENVAARNAAAIAANYDYFDKDKVRAAQQEFDAQAAAMNAKYGKGGWDTPESADAYKKAWEVATFGRLFSDMRADAAKAGQEAVAASAEAARVQAAIEERKNAAMARARTLSITRFAARGLGVTLDENGTPLFGGSIAEEFRLLEALDQLVGILGRVERFGIRSEIDGTALTRQVSTRQQSNANLIGAMGGF